MVYVVQGPAYIMMSTLKKTYIRSLLAMEDTPAAYIKRFEFYPYRFNGVSAKLRFNCPTAILHSTIGTRVIRTVQRAVSFGQRPLSFTS